MSGEEADCPLCLCPLEGFDRSHPIQCPSRHCHFNSCLDCLERMIKATKGDSTEASDGNVFRVFLHCPNCRSNLGPSIRDTVLLRKVDKYRAFQHLDAAHGDGTEVCVDERLTASELRFKYALEKDENIAAAIDAAAHREDEFFGKGVEVDATDSLDNYLGSSDRSGSGNGGSFGERQSIWSFDDEEGFEADLSGPHKSFIFRHHSQMRMTVPEEDTMQEVRMEDVEPDSTLLGGLDAFMTDEEQRFVTAQMISGETAKLAAATEMMHYVSALSREGIKPSMKRRQSSRLSLVRCPSMKSSMLSSIKEVIREGNEARRQEEERTTTGGLASRVAKQTMQFGGVAAGRRNQKMEADMEVRRRMEYMRLHPLPLRMPKYAEATATYAHPFGLTFLDDMWDGTVLDAFSKITVSTSLLGTITISKQHAESSGVSRILDVTCVGSNKKSPRCKGKGTRHRGRGHIDTVRPRVIVASINREMGHQGVVKGDVVTHFNGEEFKGNAKELTELTKERYEGEVLTFVFNADAAVTEALKRRSMIADGN